MKKKTVLLDELKNATGNIPYGMTNDYMVAVEEGSTMVRVGTAIFGARNYNI